LEVVSLRANRKWWVGDSDTSDREGGKEGGGVPNRASRGD